MLSPFIFPFAACCLLVPCFFVLPVTAQTFAHMHTVQPHKGVCVCVCVVSIFLFVQVLKRRGVTDKHLPTSREEASVLIKLLLNIRPTSSSAAEGQAGAKRGGKHAEAGKTIVSASASGASAHVFCSCARVCTRIRACVRRSVCVPLHLCCVSSEHISVSFQVRRSRMKRRLGRGLSFCTTSCPPSLSLRVLLFSSSLHSSRRKRVPGSG